jgi:hypothetical protein
VDFYILAKASVYLFLSIIHPSTLVFNEPIEYVSLGKNKDVEVVRSQNHKILIIQSKGNIERSNMIVITKNHHYQFNVSTRDNDFHSLVYVYPGEINQTFIKKEETAKFRILEGDQSILFQNKTNEILHVNGVKVRREEYFSKGAPIMIENDRVFN